MLMLRTRVRRNSINGPRDVSVKSLNEIDGVTELRRFSRRFRLRALLVVLYIEYFSSRYVSYVCL